MARTGRPKIHIDPQRTGIVLDRSDLEQLDDLRGAIDCTRSEYIRGVLRDHIRAARYYALERLGDGVLLKKYDGSSGSLYTFRSSSKGELWNLIEQIAGGRVVVEVDQ